MVDRNRNWFHAAFFGIFIWKRLLDVILYCVFSVLFSSYVFVLFCSCFETGSICKPDWPITHYEVNDIFEFLALLMPLPCARIINMWHIPGFSENTLIKKKNSQVKYTVCSPESEPSRKHVQEPLPLLLLLNQRLVHPSASNLPFPHVGI